MDLSDFSVFTRDDPYPALFSSRSGNSVVDNTLDCQMRWLSCESLTRSHLRTTKLLVGRFQSKLHPFTIGNLYADQIFRKHVGAEGKGLDPVKLV